MNLQKRLTIAAVAALIATPILPTIAAAVIAQSAPAAHAGVGQ